MNHISARALVILALTVAGIVLCGDCVRASEVSLKLDLVDQVIPQDGVLVGDIVLKNVSNKEIFQTEYMFSVLAGRVRYHVEYPNGQSHIYTGMAPATFYTVQQIRLAPGEFIKKPMCLMTYNMKSIFYEIGRYRIMVEFLAENRIISEWIELEVVEGGKGRESFKNCHDFINLIDAFRSYRGWAESMAPHIEEYEDYSREMAKLVIYNWNDKVIGRILKTRDKDPGVLKMAAEGLALARRYGIGVEMWEYMNDRAEHPEKVNTPDGVHVCPRNEYYF